MVFKLSSIKLYIDDYKWSISICYIIMYFQPDYEYAKEAALITEEILRQRIKGVKRS